MPVRCFEGEWHFPKCLRGHTATPGSPMLRGDGRDAQEAVGMEKTPTLKKLKRKLKRGLIRLNKSSRLKGHEGLRAR